MRRLLAIALLLGGCYAPSAPSGSYQCSAKGECPANLLCECGQCVKSVEAAACGFEVTLLPSEAQRCKDGVAFACVREGELMRVSITAYTKDGKASRYTGPVAIESAWGHVTTDGTISIVEGKAEGRVALDRATPANGSTALVARVAGGYGTSLQSVAVDPPDWILDGADPAAQPRLVVPVGTETWNNLYLGFPALDRGAAAPTLYFSALGTAPPIERGYVGSATLGAGGQWVVSPQPLLSPPGGEFFLAPTVLRDGAVVRLAFSHLRNGGKGAADLSWGVSRDGGRSFEAPATTLVATACPFCSGSGVLFAWAMRHPFERSEWMLFFNGYPTQPMGGSLPSGLGLARTRTDGQEWTLTPIPTPATGQVSAASAVAPRVIYDAATATYRMWYASAAQGEIKGDCPLGICPLGQICGPGNKCSESNPCRLEIRYATSVDGRVFVGTRETTVLSLERLPAVAREKNRLGQQPVGLIPGAVEAVAGGVGGARYAIYLSPVIYAFQSICVPNGVFVAYRR